MADGRILIAEDEETLRDALRLYLTSRGYDVTVAPDGRAALEELDRAEYDLLVTDMRMPRMSGEELLDALDARPGGHPPVVVMTAHGTVDSAIRGIKSGISGYIRKPLNMDELEVAVGAAIERQRLDAELKRYYAELDRKVEERTRELSLINAFSEVVNRSFDLDTILDGAVDNLVDALETDAAWIYLLDGDPPLLRLRASRGFSGPLLEEASTINPEDGYKGTTFVHGKSFIFDDLSAASVPLGPRVAAEGFTSAIHAAIKSGDRIFGSMGIASKTGKGFEEGSLELLTSFGNQIGVAIDRIRLYEREKATALDLHGKVNQLVILNEMGHLARVSNRLNEAANVVVSAIVQGVGFDRVCIWLYDDEGGNLTLTACHGLGSDERMQVLSIDGSGFSGLPVEEGVAFLTAGSVCDVTSGLYKPVSDEVCMAVSPLVTRNPHNRELHCWEHFHCGEKGCPAFNNMTLGCWMIKDSCVRGANPAATLLDKMEVCKDCDVYKANRRGKNIGIICADNRATGRRITDDDVKALNVFSNSAATLLENIRLMERLVKEERFIDGIIFNMSSGLLVTDHDGRVKMLNYAGAEILGCEHDEVVGGDFTKLFPEAARFINVEGTSSIGREVVVTTKRGPVPVGYSNSTLLEDNGVSDGVIVVFRDLSEIKKLHDQLREKDRFAAIGKVAAGVAHEIRNPLFGITSVAQILAREAKEDSPTRALIDAMLSETSRLNTLVEDMLLYGRTMKAAPQAVDLNALIESVVDFHMAGIRDKDIRVVKDLDPGLPPLMLDPHQMRQVFLNVLVNALDACRRGGEVLLRTRMSDNTVSVRISDNGIGVPVDDLSKVFDLFYTTKEKGTGLGLAICRKIVEDHGGTVTIHSKPDVGTTVELLMPAGKLGEAIA
ncbi:MAG: response regulator [Nitrospirae bacterium]|nr:response regulator [Nitrospirota bacterium]